MEFCRTEQDDKGDWIIDSDQTVRLKANYVISAFGSGLYESDGKINKTICDMVYEKELCYFFMGHFANMVPFR